MKSIGVCGASSKLTKLNRDKALEIGKLIAKNNCWLVSGGTTGASEFSSAGAVAEGGLTIGISPAANLKEHVGKYELPVTEFSKLIFTGLGYKGRNALIVQSSDAVIFIGGGVGTLNEMCVAVDEGKWIGILDGSGGACELTDEISRISLRNKPKFVIESDPEKLVTKLVSKIN